MLDYPIPKLLYPTNRVRNVFEVVRESIDYCINLFYSDLPI